MGLSIKEVKSEIEKLSSMKELTQDRFCEEGGYADILVQEWGREKLKPTQLRKVFSQLKAVERDVEKSIKSEVDWNKPFDRTKVIPLMPLLAYATGRNLMPKDFYDIMRTCLSAKKMNTNLDFKRLAEFVEAILAYHKFRYA